MWEACETFWRWLTTGRYTRTLEAEVERLRAENRALLNSLLGTAGFPPIEVPAAKVPVPRVRRRSWQQIAALREIEEVRRAQHANGGTTDSVPS
jgi:hypothetical protein